MRHLVLVIALLGAGLQAADAADSPAQMVVGERSIEELLRIPDTLKPGRYSVHCGVKVGTSGWTLFVRCYSMTDSPPDELQTAVMHATRTSLFVPATRDGKPVDVFVMLAVTVDTTLGEPLILAVLNNGADAARYGLLYTAPQRYGSSHINLASLPARATPRTAVVWMKLQIDAQGVMTDCTLTNESGAPDWWVTAVRAAAKKMTFIPGYHDGKAAPMLYVQPMLWNY